MDTRQYYGNNSSYIWWTTMRDQSHTHTYIYISKKYALTCHHRLACMHIVFFLIYIMEFNMLNVVNVVMRSAVRAYSAHVSVATPTSDVTQHVHSTAHARRTTTSCSTSCVCHSVGALGCWVFFLYCCHFLSISFFNSFLFLSFLRPIEGVIWRMGPPPGVTYSSTSLIN